MEILRVAWLNKRRVRKNDVKVFTRVFLLICEGAKEKAGFCKNGLKNNHGLRALFIEFLVFFYIDLPFVIIFFCKNF